MRLQRVKAKGIPLRVQKYRWPGESRSIGSLRPRSLTGSQSRKPVNRSSPRQPLVRRAKVLIWVPHHPDDAAGVALR
jgi:hypothetical protein